MRNFFPEIDDRPNSPKQSEYIVRTVNINILAFMESSIDQETLESFQEHLPEEQKINDCVKFGRK